MTGREKAFSEVREGGGPMETGTGSGERSLGKDVSVSAHLQFGWAFSNLASQLLVMFWA